jgi:acyl dehydratase
MDPQSLHLNAAFSASAEFGERLVNSLLTTSVLVGLSVGHLTQATTNLGFRDTKVPAPGRHSDTTYGERVGTEKRLSTSRPGQGSSRSSTWPAISTARSWQSSSGPR